jgi:hypothetical protein
VGASSWGVCPGTKLASLGWSAEDIAQLSASSDSSWGIMWGCPPQRMGGTYLTLSETQGRLGRKGDCSQLRVPVFCVSALAHDFWRN